MDHDSLTAVTEADRTQLLALASSRRFHRREVIFHTGDPGEGIFLIRSGHVTIRIVTEYGDTATLAVLGPGDTFGELALLAAEHRRSATAAALEPTEVLMLTGPQLMRARSDGLPVDAFLLQLLTNQIHRLTRQLSDALYVPVRHRVVRALLALCAQYETGSESVTLLITQDDVAGLAGATRPTVNQVLQRLEASGAIALHRGRIEVTDQAELRRHRG